jgi:predicted ATPase/class 3 adenylate cyclase
MSTSIRHLLQQQGLEAYLPVFEASQIDLGSLSMLSDAHLKEMGMPIGARIRLLAAIRRHGAATEDGERRQLTVMFADLVGSTQLSSRIDPEDMRDVIRSFYDAVEAETARCDATIAQFKGDGALVYFGYPRAREDDASRAVQAAMAIVRAVQALRAPTGESLAAHVGIATGLAVVGEASGLNIAREHSAVGETPNLAARLVDFAASGQIVVSRQTHRLTQHQFAFEELGGHTLKGLPHPEALYRVLYEYSNETRFDAMHGGTPTQMVGRDRELRMLQERWQMAVAGKGQVVLLPGEPGIGKSRLLHALQRAIAPQQHVRVVNQCSPHQTGNTLFPMAQQIARAAGIVPGDDAGVQWQKLEKLLQGSDGVDLALTAELLGLARPAHLPVMDLTPAELRRATFSALMHHLERIASSAPVLWILEDAHWSDATSLELVKLYTQRVKGMRMLAIITYRPEFASNLVPADHISTLELPRLAPEDVAVMVRNLCAGQTVDPMALAQITARTDGIPLFVEELTKSLLESGALVERDLTYVLRKQHLDANVPASLHDSLMARLDRHQMQKEVAQIAACIGREFAHALLLRVAGMTEEALDEALAQLQDAELVYVRGTGADRQYLFKHALVRDAAYASLVKRKREELHAHVLAALEAAADTPAELLAHHATAAGLRERAIALWARAGAQAMSRYAFAEAVSDLRNALALLPAEGADAETLARRLDLLLALGQATIPLRGYSHSASVEVFSEAYQLAQRIDDTQRAFWVAYARWVVYYVRGEHAVAYGVAQSMVQQTLDDKDQGRTLTALRTRGISEMILGTPQAAAATFQQAERLAYHVRQQARERRLAVAQRFAADPEIATQFHVALTYWALGRRDEACSLSAQAISDARAMGHIHTLGHALTHGAIVAVVDRDATLALTLCDEAIGLAEKHDMDLWRGYCSLLQGYALALQDKPAVAADMLQDGLRRLAQTETGTMVSLHEAVCAWALARLGCLAQAQVHADNVARELENGSERYFWIDSLIWLSRYERVLPASDTLQANKTLQRAVDEARRQGALGWQLRASTELGSLLLDQGHAPRAVQLVAPLLAKLHSRGASSLRNEAEQLMAATSRG